MFSVLVFDVELVALVRDQTLSFFFFSTGKERSPFWSWGLSSPSVFTPSSVIISSLISSFHGPSLRPLLQRGSDESGETLLFLSPQWRVVQSSEDFLSLSVSLLQKTAFIIISADFSIYDNFLLMLLSLKYFTGYTTVLCITMIYVHHSVFFFLRWFFTDIQSCKYSVFHKTMRNKTRMWRFQLNTQNLCAVLNIMYKHHMFYYCAAFFWEDKVLF